MAFSFHLLGVRPLHRSRGPYCAHAPMPVLKPNEAMIEQAVARGGKIGLLSTFPPTLASMPPEFPASIKIVPKLAEGALSGASTAATAPSTIAW